MKFKITLLRQSETSEPLCAVGWNLSEEILACGYVLFDHFIEVLLLSSNYMQTCYAWFSFIRDERTLQKWNIMSKDAVKLCDFPENTYPIDLHCFMRNQGGVKRQKTEQILLTSTDGIIFTHLVFFYDF